MSSRLQETLDKFGEAATVAVSDTAGAVVDPKTAMKQVRSRMLRPGPLLIAAGVAGICVLIAYKRRSCSDRDRAFRGPRSRERPRR